MRPNYCQLPKPRGSAPRGAKNSRFPKWEMRFSLPDGTLDETSLPWAMKSRAARGKRARDSGKGERHNWDHETGRELLRIAD
jgi:hypothetical protein